MEFICTGEKKSIMCAHLRDTVKRKILRTYCLNIDGTHVIANNSTNNDVVFLFFVSDLKIAYYNNY